MATDRRPDIERDTRLRMYRTMVECRLLRDARPGAVLRGPGQRHDPSRRRPGGRRGRVRARRCAPTTTRSAPTAATTTRSPAACRWRRSSPSCSGGRRPARRQGRVDAPDQRRARRDGLVRDRRRPPADRARRRLVGAVPQVGPGRGLLLRRRDHQHRSVPRGAQHGRRLEGAGRLRLREQPVHGVHGDRRRDRGAAARPRTGRPPTASSRSSSTATTSTRSTRWRAPRVDRARAGDGPSLIEALTYRHGGHSRADPGKYRPDDEVAAWKARDPIPTYRARLRGRGRRRRPSSTRSTSETREAVAAAEAIARAAPEPAADVLETQVWADGGSAWRN